ncbi:MAG: hypothetical protein ACOYN4_03405 [Bacteroidales bacterium]
MDKKTNLFVLLCLFFIISSSLIANGQNNKQHENQEQIVVITDRSIYIVGEQINFSATLVNGSKNESLSASQILYCELITPEGSKISGSKFLIHQYRVAGSIDIPSDLLSGTYYLKTYTKLMRNYGPETFAYNQIRIVNPEKSGLAATGNDQKTKSTLTFDTISVIGNKSLFVSTNSNHYSSGETVIVSVRGLSVSQLQLKNLSLSVVPEATKSYSKIIPDPQGEIQNKNIYFSENHGLSLNGKLNYGATEIPINGKKVNLSIMGEGRDFMAVRTDSSGRFFFALPGYYGSRDLFLCAEKLPSKDVKIWVDNDFSTAPYPLPAPTFTLTEPEKVAVYNMALNRQIQMQYAIKVLPDTVVNRKSEKAFYGNPTSVIYLDQYIQLPTLEDYFNELPSQVKVRKHKGETVFYVIGSRDVSFYDPLVLIDWVAVDEPSKILAISPQNISRIEIVNETYIKGDQTYGGIISIISKKGDFAGIDLPSTGIFINYRFLDESWEPVAEIQQSSKSPDTRNTLLWQPNIVLKQDKETTYTFLAPDTPGKYVVFLEGVTEDGKIISETYSFEINN